MALMRMLAFRADAAEGGRTPPDTEAAKPARPAPAARAATAALPADWPSLVRTLGLTGLAGQLAQASELVRFADGEIELRVPPASKHLAEKTYQDKLRA